jgi:hypothetical protein
MASCMDMISVIKENGFNLHFENSHFKHR